MLTSSLTYTSTPVEQCRRPVVPACDPTIVTSGINPPSINNEILLVKAGDIIDVGLDWTDWIKENGGKISSSTWAAHALSPQAPTITAITLIDEANTHTVCIVDASAAAVGDIYYLTNTITVDGIAAGAFVMPTRTVNRVIHVRIVL
jgi:hypothetical protein